MIISRKKSAPTYRQAGADVFLKGKNYNIELNHVRPPLFIGKLTLFILLEVETYCSGECVEFAFYVVVIVVYEVVEVAAIADTEIQFSVFEAYTYLPSEAETLSLKSVVFIVVKPVHAFIIIVIPFGFSQ